MGSAFVAGVARGFSGFGGALIFVPLASSVIGPKLAAPLLLIIDAVGALGLIPDAAKRANRREVATMALGALIGVPLGVLALAVIDPLVVRWAIALTVILFLALIVSGWRYKEQPSALLTVGVGQRRGVFRRRSPDLGPAGYRLLARRRDTGRHRAGQSRALFRHFHRDQHGQLSRRRAFRSRGHRLRPGGRPKLCLRPLSRIAALRPRQRSDLPPHMLLHDRRGRPDQPAASRFTPAVGRVRAPSDRSPVRSDSRYRAFLHNRPRGRACDSR
nr:sulfite exporter TauE/SafE family protein [Mesorhizobium sp. RMAD-H1]